MSRRSDYLKRRRGPEKGDRYVRLPEWLLSCPAWLSLSPAAARVYVEMARRYRGPDSNNGRIPYSVREAAKAIHGSKDTAQRALTMLEDRGFIVMKTASGFNRKGRAATEWLLTEFCDDTVTGQLPLKLFMRWSPEISFHSPAGRTRCPARRTELSLPPDGVAENTRFASS